MSKEIHPLAQAYQELPRTWYEPKINALIAFTLISSGIGWEALNLLNFHSFRVHVAIATLFTISALVDRYSTVKAMNANNLARKQGITTGINEKNIILERTTDPKKFLLSKRALVVDLLALTGAVFQPGLGIGWTLGKTLAIANNLRVAKRINRAIEIDNSRKLNQWG